VSVKRKRDEKKEEREGRSFRKVGEK